MTGEADEARALRESWVWGWDETPGIVSVHAEPDGRAIVWRRVPVTGELVREDVRYRPFVVLDSIDDLRSAGVGLSRASREGSRGIMFRELDGPGALRFLVDADDGISLRAALLIGASARLGRRVRSLRELGADAVLELPPVEQYLVATGRNYFRGLDFDDLRRLQFDLETTGLDPHHDRIFLVAIRTPKGESHVVAAQDASPAAEASLIEELAQKIASADPDVIENHNLHGFDLPFLVHRARVLGVPLCLGRLPGRGLDQRPAARGASLVMSGDAHAARRRSRFTVAGRELIDTMDAVMRHDFAARDLPGYGLKAVAAHFGLAAPDREHIPGAEVYATFLKDPDRVRRYARHDVEEAAALARLLGGAAFALARLAPRRYERLADAGAATGVIDPMLVRAYLRTGAALPAHEAGDHTPHSGAALHLFASGVARRIVKADVASLYPSLMRQYRIGPSRDRLGALLAIVDELVEQRLAAKARARQAAPGSREKIADEALSQAMKLVVNSAYGYLGATSLTRFADVHAANEVTRRGRELLGFMCHALADRSMTLLEADTDGVYFAVPEHFEPDDERRVVAEVAALLPPLVSLEFDGRYAAMLSHEPKNYALLGYDGELVLRGVAFRSRRAEPFGDTFLRRAIAALFHDDLSGVRAAFVETAGALSRRELPTRDVTTEVRLTKTPAEYRASAKRELPYEAMLAHGSAEWSVGTRIRVYRAEGGRARLYREPDTRDDALAGMSEATRDYDAAYYVALLRRTFAARLARALAPEVLVAVTADPAQLELFEPNLTSALPILTLWT